MAMKDILGRFKREPEEDFIPEEEYLPEEAPVAEKPSFVFTDINSEPIVPVSIFSFSNRMFTPSATRLRTISRQSDVLRANRLMDLVRII